MDDTVAEQPEGATGFQIRRETFDSSAPRRFIAVVVIGLVGVLGALRVLAGALGLAP